MKEINRGAILPLLKKAAEAYWHQLEEQVTPKLGEREKSLLDWLFVQYQDEDKKRWYDPCHILFSTKFALELVDKENLDPLIVAGIILHDIGYFALKDKSQWSAKESRITHMQEGTPRAAKVLYDNGFTSLEVEKTLGMISVHDNPYIGIPIQGEARLGLRDCDRVWVMHMLSFYKDLVSRPERCKKPREFLHDRMTQFYGWEHPFGAQWKVTLNRVVKNAERIELPRYDVTKEYVTKQFERRIQEMDDGLVLDEDKFRKHLKNQIGIE